MAGHISINHKENLNSFVDYGTPLLTFLFYFQPFLTGRLFLYPWKEYMRNERNCQAILHSLPCPCYHADCFTHYGGSCGGKAILDDGQGKRRAWLKRLWMTAVSALHSMKAGSSLREKPPIVSTSTRTLFLATRPEPMQAHAWVPTDKRRCPLFGIRQAVRKDAQQSQWQASVPFGTVRRLAEVKRSSGLGVRQRESFLWWNPEVCSRWSLHRSGSLCQSE